MPKSFSCTVDNSLCQSLWRRVKARRYDLRHHRELVNERISRRGLLIIENLMSGSRGRLASREIKSRGSLELLERVQRFSLIASHPPLSPRVLITEQRNYSSNEGPRIFFDFTRASKCYPIVQTLFPSFLSFKLTTSLGIHCGQSSTTPNERARWDQRKKRDISKVLSSWYGDFACDELLRCNVRYLIGRC